jgi:hypothetical protein
MFVGRRSVYLPDVRHFDPDAYRSGAQRIQTIGYDARSTDLLAGFVLRVGFGPRPAPAYSLEAAQKVLITNSPVVSLLMGGSDLSADVVRYRYQEVAREPGGLSLWLDNRGNQFGATAGAWPGLAVDLSRGQWLNGVRVLEALPRVWVESVQFVHDAGQGLVLVHCLDGWGKLRRFRYQTETTWAGQDVAVIVDAILRAAGLTGLDAGLFGVTVDFTAGQFTNADQLVRSLMNKTDFELYAKPGGVFGARRLTDGEGGAYAYAWDGSGHPLLPGTEVAQASARYNAVRVEGDGVTGTAEDSAEVSAHGYRWLVVRDSTLTTSAQCEARASAELDLWLSKRITGKLLTRPNYQLRVHDVVSVGVPPWGGSAISSARVVRYWEICGAGVFEQEITVGGLEVGATLARGSWGGGDESGEAGELGGGGAGWGDVAGLVDLLEAQEEMTGSNQLSLPAGAVDWNMVYAGLRTVEATSLGLYFEFTGISTSEVEILPVGAVEIAVRTMFVVRKEGTSSGVAGSGSYSLGTSGGYNIGGSQFWLKLKTDGSFVAYRVGGSGTYALNIWVVWM